jgi:predicted amidohydrolase YtcJ
MFLEDRVGSLEVGKYADIAVWDTDLYSAEPDAIKNMKCQMTLLEGEVVFRVEESPQTTNGAPSIDRIGLLVARP